MMPIYLALGAIAIAQILIFVGIAFCIYDQHAIAQAIRLIGEQLGQELELMKVDKWEPNVVVEEPPTASNESLFTPAEGARFDTDAYMAAAAGIDTDDENKR